MTSPIDPTPRAVIFDFDGTLADTFALVVAAFNSACADLLGREYRADEVIALFGHPDPRMLRDELSRHGVDEARCDEAIERYHAEYEAQHEIATAFEGVEALLQSLRARDLPLGVMTGKGRRTADITLRKLGWDNVFQSVVTGDDVERQKPEPDGVLLVARHLEVPPNRCAFVGDSPADIRAGKAAGMTTIVAGWHPVYHQQLKPLEPDFWASSPLDVARMVGAM